MNEKAINDLFDRLPSEMIELTRQAIKLQDRIAETTDEVEKAALKMELELLNNQIMRSTSEAKPAEKRLA